MTAWATSPTYGAVMLGPTQRIVLDVALSLTRNGRRPELTLGQLAKLCGRPVSSVHEAVGRLRALGLLGVSARMGRNGGHRLWSVRAGPPSRTFDQGRRRRAIARIVRRFFPSHVALAGTQERQAEPPDPPDGGSAKGDAERVVSGLDPFGVTPSTWSPAPKGETFHEKMKRYGIGDWIDRKDHERGK